MVFPLLYWVYKDRKEIKKKLKKEVLVSYSATSVWSSPETVDWRRLLNVHFQPLSTPLQPSVHPHTLHGTVHVIWQSEISLLPGHVVCRHRRHAQTDFRFRWSSDMTRRRFAGRVVSLLSSLCDVDISVSPQSVGWSNTGLHVLFGVGTGSTSYLGHSQNVRCGWHR